jgi:hypothetical protein
MTLRSRLSESIALPAPLKDRSCFRFSEACAMLLEFGGQYVISPLVARDFGFLRNQHKKKGFSRA